MALKKKTIIINSLTILVSAYKIISFILSFKNDFFEWGLPALGQIFSYLPFCLFMTFFLIPVPFGIYFIVLIFYLLAATFLMVKSIRREVSRRGLLFSILLLIGAIGSWILFIGE